MPIFVIPKVIESCQLFCISFLILNFKSRHDPLSHDSIAEEDDILLTFRFVGFCVKPTFNIKKIYKVNICLNEFINANIRKSSSFVYFRVFQLNKIISFFYFFKILET